MKFVCKICNTELDLDKCQVFKSKCFINHVDLIRYKCTTCGVIFGTLDMINGTTDYVKNTYLSLDKVYKEGDSLSCEYTDFFSLNPKKDGLYLNFGCGNTSTTIPHLKKLGYSMMGFEPYLPVKDPSIITNKQDLLNYKFDGIISNNLLEHLQDPIQELLFMKGLLKDKDCLMSHSTACYRYIFEYSLYHLYFFVDKAVDYLCQNAGLVIKDFKRNDNWEYMNYIYAQKQ